MNLRFLGIIYSASDTRGNLKLLMRKGISLRKVPLLTAMAGALALVVFGAVPAFAWTSSLSTTPQPSASVAVGTSISDMASLTLTSEIGTASGTVYFYLYAGTCTSVTGSALYSSTASVVSSNNGATKQYGSGSFSTTGLSAGSYVWLVRYSGGGGWPATPTTGTLVGGNYYDCEPISLTVSHGVPEFSVGLPLLLGLAIPALLLVRARRPMSSA